MNLKKIISSLMALSLVTTLGISSVSAEHSTNTAVTVKVTAKPFDEKEAPSRYIHENGYTTYLVSYTIEGLEPPTTGNPVTFVTLGGPVTKTSDDAIHAKSFWLKKNAGTGKDQNGVNECNALDYEEVYQIMGGVVTGSGTGGNLYDQSIYMIALQNTSKMESIWTEGPSYDVFEGFLQTLIYVKDGESMTITYGAADKVDNGKTSVTFKDTSETTNITVKVNDTNSNVLTLGTPAEPDAVTGVTVDKDSVSVQKGGTEKSEEITATVRTTGNPANTTVAWAITGEGANLVELVETIGNKTKVQLKAGAEVTADTTATLTASLAEFSDTTTINILKAAVIEPTGISLDKYAITLLRGDTETLVATKDPENAQGTIVWSSSNSNVATVNNGVVTAVSKGTATITAEIEGTDFSASCVVTVNNPAIGFTFKNYDDVDKDGWFYGNATGYVWKVEVANRYENQPIEATFTAGGESTSRLLPLNKIQLEGTIRFDIILKSTRENVKIDVHVPQAN